MIEFKPRPDVLVVSEEDATTTLGKLGSFDLFRHIDRDGHNTTEIWCVVDAFYADDRKLCCKVTGTGYNTPHNACGVIRVKGRLVVEDKAR